MIKLNYKSFTQKRDIERGFSIPELLITMSLFGLLCGVAVSNLRVLENPLVSSSANLAHYLRLVRVRAVAQTRSIKVHPTSVHHIIAESGASCTGNTFTPISNLTLNLGNDVALSSIDWSVCYTPRGLVNDSAIFQIGSNTGTRTVEIALGGGVKIQ